MKIAWGTVAALLLIGSAWSAPAQAQYMPQGSYLQTCRDVGVQGDTLFAVCRTVDGRGERAIGWAHRICRGRDQNRGRRSARRLVGAAARARARGCAVSPRHAVDLGGHGVAAARSAEEWVRRHGDRLPRVWRLDRGAER